MSQPLIIGSGPAGSLAAILLARSGVEPILIDRDAEIGNALCGGFMSWRTAARLRAIGLDLTDLGAQRVDRLALFASEHSAVAQLPEAGFGLSRYALDSAMREKAVEAGARLVIDRIRSVENGIATGQNGEWRSDAIFLASGKHDIRGLSRPRIADDPAMGIRIAVPGNAALTELIGNRIELHFFRGGYAGIVLQEERGGARVANICLAMRKSRLVDAGGTPRALLDELARDHPAFGARMQHAVPDLPVDSIGAVPYGWIARDTAPGL
ncbi:MAG: FAD-dependent monooxygenase, partial [Pontixanthobacter sp.]